MKYGNMCRAHVSEYVFEDSQSTYKSTGSDPYEARVGQNAPEFG